MCPTLDDETAILCVMVQALNVACMSILLQQRCLRYNSINAERSINRKWFDRFSKGFTNLFSFFFPSSSSSLHWFVLFSSRASFLLHHYFWYGTVNSARQTRARKYMIQHVEFMDGPNTMTAMLVLKNMDNIRLHLNFMINYISFKYGTLMMTHRNCVPKTYFKSIYHFDKRTFDLKTIKIKWRIKFRANITKEFMSENLFEI